MADILQTYRPDPCQNTVTGIPFGHHQSLAQVLRSYSQLVKPKIIALLLMTTAGAMWMAGNTDPFKFGVTLLGGGWRRQQPMSSTWCTTPILIG